MQAAERANVDDAPAGRTQMGIRRLRHEERATRIGLEHLVPLRQADRLQRCGLKGSRVINQSVQAAELFYYSSNRRLNAVEVAHIARDRHRTHVELL